MYNQKYETIFCAQRIKTDGEALLAAYKQFILTDYIPKSLEAEAAQTAIDKVSVRMESYTKATFPVTA